MLRALGPELTARLDPTYPADNPVVTQEAWSGDGLRDRRADRRRAALDGPRRRGQRLQQLGRLRRALGATGTPLIAGDPHLPPSMPGIWYEVEPAPRRALRPRRLAAGDAGRSTWARTTTSAGRSPTSWPTSRTSSSSGSRATATCSRTSGGRWRRSARRSSSRAAPSRSSLDVRSPTTARSSTRRSAPTRPSRWRWPG